jgi:hypothetical protein
MDPDEQHPHMMSLKHESTMTDMDHEVYGCVVRLNQKLGETFVILTIKRSSKGKTPGTTKKKPRSLQHDDHHHDARCCLLLALLVFALHPWFPGRIAPHEIVHKHQHAPPPDTESALYHGQ